MVKKLGWPWIFGALALGWYIGGQPDNDHKEPVRFVKEIKTKQMAPSAKLQYIAPKIVKPESSSMKVAKTIPKKIKITKLEIEKPIQKVTVSKDQVMFVDASKLNVRNAPDRTGKQIWTLKRDDKVTVTKKKGEWSYVKGIRYQGWVFGAYLTPKKSLSTQKTSLQPSAIVAPKLSSAEVRKLLIERSIGFYNGSCPCPYNITRAGRRCGKRSAYSRPGGASPLCYSSDVTDGMVSDYLARL